MAEDMTGVKDLESIMDNVYLINKGVRSCFMESIVGPEDDISYDDEIIELSVIHQLHKIKRYSEENGLYFYTYQLSKDKNNLDDRVAFIYWIYKYPHQGVVLRSMQHNHSYLEEWAIGKLLGYSDASIEEFLQRHKSTYKNRR